MSKNGRAQEWYPASAVLENSGVARKYTEEYYRRDRVEGLRSAGLIEVKLKYCSASILARNGRR